MSDLKETKVALVTGGSRGIGKGVALVLADAGYDVAITYTGKKELAETVAAQILQKGRRATVIQGELTLEETPQRIVDSCLHELGRIDVLVNNAGRTIFGNILKIDLASINLLINLDFKSYVLLTQAAARHMVEAKIPGNIVNITSTRGQRSYPGDGVYGGLKAALARATQSFALDLAPYGIRVNSVAPGCTPHGAFKSGDKNRDAYEDFRQRIPLKRFGTGEDIGNAVAWLVSDHASYITGQTLNVDGGLILPGMPEFEGSMNKTQNKWA
jgi:glucose 1-dehydrogenase